MGDGNIELWGIQTRDLPPSTLTSLTRLAAEGLRLSPLGCLLVRSPVLFSKFILLAEYSVCDAELPAQSRALLILLVTRKLKAGPLWGPHKALATQLGLPDEIIRQIESGVQPSGLSEPEEALYELMTELLDTYRIGTSTFRRVTDLFDERALIDAFGVLATFACQAIYINAFERGDADLLQHAPAVVGTPEHPDEAPRHRNLGEDDLNLHQRQIVEGESYRRIMTIGTGLGGPNGHLLRSPALMGAFYPFAEYCKCDPALPAKIREIVIITTARLWGAEYAWSAHCPTAISCGVSASAADAIGEGRIPDDFDVRERTAFDICCELFYDNRLSDGTFERMLKEFDDVEQLDIVSIFGEYVLLSAVLNAYRFPAWSGRVEPLAKVANPFR